MSSKEKRKGYTGEVKTVDFFWKHGIKARRLANLGRNDPDVIAGSKRVECKKCSLNYLVNPARILLEHGDDVVMVWVDYQRAPILTLWGKAEVMKLLEPFFSKQKDKPLEEKE